MGGGFDPFHFGHKNVFVTVKKKFHIDQFIIIPTYQTPLKENHTNSFHRLNMLKQVFLNHPDVIIDEQEIDRKGISYSYKSCLQIVKTNPKAEIFLIIGMDQLTIFDQWKHFVKILENINLIVASRYGFKFFNKISEFPKKMQKFLNKKQGHKVSLKNSKKHIYFCQLKDRNISSSMVKTKLKEGKSIQHLVPAVLRSYIQTHNLYVNQAEDLLKKKVDFCKQELAAKKAFNIQTFDLKDRNLPFVIITSCPNTTQTKFLALFLIKRMKERFGAQILSKEGQAESRWIVLDYGDLIIHIFYDYTRRHYNLEELWAGKKKTY